MQRYTVTGTWNHGEARDAIQYAQTVLDNVAAAELRDVFLSAGADFVTVEGFAE